MPANVHLECVTLALHAKHPCPRCLVISEAPTLPLLTSRPLSLCFENAAEMGAAPARSISPKAIFPMWCILVKLRQQTKARAGSKNEIIGA